jgi:hypothetical protein
LYSDSRIIFSDTGLLSHISIQAYLGGALSKIECDTLQNLGTVGRVLSLSTKKDNTNLYDSVVVTNSTESALHYAFVVKTKLSGTNVASLTLGSGALMSPLVPAPAPVAIEYKPVTDSYLPDLQVKAIVMDSIDDALDTVVLQNKMKTDTYSGWYLNYPHAGTFWVKILLEGKALQTLWPTQNFGINGLNTPLQSRTISLDSLQNNSVQGQFFIEGEWQNTPATCSSSSVPLSMQNRRIIWRTRGLNSEDCFVVRDTSSVPLALHLANVVGVAPTLSLRDSTGKILSSEMLHATHSVAGYWSWVLPPSMLHSGLQAVVKASNPSRT